MSAHLSHLVLDELRLGLVPEMRAAELRSHLAGCLRCAATAASLEEDAQAFRTRFVPQGLAAETLARAAAPSRAPGFRSRLHWLVPGAAACAALVLILRPGPDTRLKGGDDALGVYVMEGDAPVPQVAAVSPGSRLRIRFRLTAPAHLRWLWRDERGRLKPLLPEAHAPSLEAAPGVHWLEREIVLDTATVTEHLYLVRCAAPFDHSGALAIVSGQSRAGCAVTTRALSKQ